MRLAEGLEDETSSNANDEKETRVYTGLTVSTRRMSSGGDGDGDGESSGLSSPGSGSDHSPSSRHSSAGGTGGGLATPNSHTTGGGLSGSGNGAGHGDRPSKRGRDGQKTTRVRTVLNEKQLQTLRTCYAANPRPDALMKEQLVEMTGLSPRVIRVWFQNKRCATLHYTNSSTRFTRSDCTQTPARGHRDFCPKCLCQRASGRPASRLAQMAGGAGAYAHAVSALEKLGDVRQCTHTDS